MVGQKHKRMTVNVTGCRFDFYGEKNYLIFSFFCSGNEVKRGVKVRQSTRNASNSVESRERKCLNENRMS